MQTQNDFEKTGNTFKRKLIKEVAINFKQHLKSQMYKKLCEQREMQDCEFIEVRGASAVKEINEEEVLEEAES